MKINNLQSQLPLPVGLLRHNCIKEQNWRRIKAINLLFSVGDIGFEPMMEFNPGPYKDPAFEPLGQSPINHYQ